MKKSTIIFLVLFVFVIGFIINTLGRPKESVKSKDSSEVTERESWKDIRDRHTKKDTETCDREGARQLLNTMKENYNLKFDSHSNILYVDMEEGWYSMDMDTKHRFLRAIANLDACIEGKARHIYIEAWGQRVAEATPMGGFKILK